MPKAHEARVQDGISVGPVAGEGVSIDLTSLYRSLAPCLRSQALRDLRDPNLAEDAVQETFLRAVQRISTFDDSRRPEPWLVWIGSKVRLDLMRRARSRAALAVRFEMSQPAAQGREPHDQLMAHESARAIALALASLDERPRRVLMARAEGRRVAEIAAAENTSAEAVRSMVARARRKVRAIYDVEAGKRGLKSWLPPVLAPAGLRVRIWAARCRDRIACSLQSGALAPVVADAVAGFVTVAVAAAVLVAGPRADIAGAALRASAPGSAVSALGPGRPHGALPGVGFARTSDDRSVSAGLVTPDAASALGAPQTRGSAQVSRDDTLNARIWTGVGQEDPLYGHGVAWMDCRATELRRTLCDAVSTILPPPS